MVRSNIDLAILFVRETMAASVIKHCWRAFSRAKADIAFHDKLHETMACHYFRAGLLSTTFKIWSDNCGKQYRSFRVYGRVAEWGYNMRRFPGLEKSRLRMMHMTTISKHGKDEGDGESATIKNNFNKAETRGVTLPTTYHIFRYAVEMCSVVTEVIKKYTNIFYLVDGEEQPSGELRDLTKAQLTVAAKKRLEYDTEQYDTLPISMTHDDYAFSTVKGIMQLHQVVGLFPPPVVEGEVIEKKGMGSKTEILTRRYPCVSCPGCLDPININSSEQCKYLDQLPGFNTITMERGRFSKQKGSDDVVAAGEEEQVVEPVIVTVQAEAGSECETDEHPDMMLMDTAELNFSASVE
jgi:hypothetical protein